MVNGCVFLEELETINGLEYDCEHPEYSGIFTCDHCPLGPKSTMPKAKKIKRVEFTFDERSLANREDFPNAPEFKFYRA